MVELTDKKAMAALNHSIPLFYEENFNASIRSIKDKGNITSLDVSDEMETSRPTGNFRDTQVDTEDAETLKNV